MGYCLRTLCKSILGHSFSGNSMKTKPGLYVALRLLRPLRNPTQLGNGVNPHTTQNFSEGIASPTRVKKWMFKTQPSVVQSVFSVGPENFTNQHLTTSCRILNIETLLETMSTMMPSYVLLRRSIFLSG